MPILDRLAVRRYLRTRDEAAPLFAHPLKMHRLVSHVESMAADDMPPSELQAQADAAVTGATGPILEALVKFLNDHWADILKIIEKLLGM